MGLFGKRFPENKNETKREYKWDMAYKMFLKTIDRSIHIIVIILSKRCGFVFFITFNNILSFSRDFLNFENGDKCV